MSFIAFQAHSLAAGTLTAWSPNLLLGFDALALPFSFAPPLVLLPLLFGSADLVVALGYATFGLLALTLLLTYWVVYGVTHDRLSALAGACTYGFTTYALVKLAQNDQTYLSIVFAPLLFHIVRNARRHTLARSLCLMFAMNVVLLYFAFLQEYSYIMLFMGVYVVALACKGKLLPAVTFMISEMAAIVVALPRLIAQANTVRESARIDPGGLGEYVGPLSLLRYLDRDLFGRSFSEHVFNTPLDPLNLYEGNLLYVSFFATFILIVVVLRLGRIDTLRSVTTVTGYELRIMLGWIVVVFAIVHVQPIYHVFGMLYRQASFLHTRVDVAAMLPIALITALYVTRSKEPNRPRGVRLGVIAVVCVAVSAASAYDYDGARDALFRMAGQQPLQFLPCPGCQPGEIAPMHTAELLRLGGTAVLFGSLGLLSATTRLLSKDEARTILAVVVTFQAVWGASDYLMGDQTRTYDVPFKAHDLVVARAPDFAMPSTEQVRELQVRLDNDHFRSILICPLDVFSVDCSTAIGLDWRVRLVDGYLSGLSKRFEALPWSAAGPSLNVSPRSLRFVSSDHLPWKLLSVLNVRQAVVVSPQLQINAAIRPEDVQLIVNPSPYVYPRVYLAGHAESVSADEAPDVMRAQLMVCATCSDLLDHRIPVDYLEGPVQGDFDDSGEVVWAEDNDRFTIEFPASDHRRLAIVNEQYAQGWTAQVDGGSVPVYSANLVMRGIVVPAGATRVTLVYQSFLTQSWGFILLSSVAFVLGSLILALRLRAPGLRIE